MTFLVGIPCCNVPTAIPEIFAETIEAIAKSTRQPAFVIIVDNGDKPLEEKLLLRGGLPSILRRPHRNTGCAGGWNEICAWMMENHLPTIILNDDCAVAPNTFAQMLDEPKGYFICGRGFSCFRIEPEIFQRVGPFDEEFYPAYFEDADYRRRMRLIGIPIIEWSVEEIATISPGRTRSPSGIVHGKHAADGSYQSWTGEKLQWFKDCYEANKRRYSQKWGGEPDNETFVVPFNEVLEAP